MRRRFFRHCATALLAAPFALGAFGCDESVTAPRPATTASSVEVLRAPRRPDRVFFLGKEDGKCSVYWSTKNQLSIEQPCRCPRTLKHGERIRMIGKVCHREEGGAGRNVMVRCPSALVRVEKADREKTGPALKPRATTSP